MLWIGSDYIEDILADYIEDILAGYIENILYGYIEDIINTVDRYHILLILFFAIFAQSSKVFSVF